MSAIFAAAMRGVAHGTWIAAALASMRQPSSAAAEALLAAGAHACTDVTGFGLAGHLAEMIRASGAVAVDLDLDALPALDGAVELFARGFASSLQPENLRARHLIDGMDTHVHHPKLPLLFDPQTAGGLLISVGDAQAAQVLSLVKSRGFGRAAIIGRVSEGSGRISLTS